MVLEAMAATFAMAQAFRNEASCEKGVRTSKIYARRLVIVRGVDSVMVEGEAQEGCGLRSELISGNITKRFQKDPDSPAPLESELLKRKEGCGGLRGRVLKRPRISE